MRAGHLCAIQPGSAAAPLQIEARSAQPHAAHPPIRACPPSPAQVFAAAKKAGYLPEGRTVRIDHVGFGLVLGEDGKKFRSRSGDVSPGAQSLRAMLFGPCGHGALLFAVAP